MRAGGIKAAKVGDHGERLRPKRVQSRRLSAATKAAVSSAWKGDRAAGPAYVSVKMNQSTYTPVVCSRCHQRPSAAAARSFEVAAIAAMRA